VRIDKSPFRRALAFVAFVVATATASVGLAQATASPPAIGMVDQPCPPGSFGRTDVEEAFARTVVTDGPMDVTVLKAYMAGAAERTKADADRLTRDWADLCRYRQADADVVKNGGAKVVFLGNSITELWQAADPDLFKEGVVNRGISGQTSGQALARFYQDVVQLHPKVVHIMEGTNDVAGNAGPNRPEDFKNNIRAMVDIAKSNHIQVILASITPAGKISWQPALKPVPIILELNTWLEAYAKSRSLIYVDYYSALATPEGAMPAAISRDGVHPTRAGYSSMTPLAKAVIAKALSQAVR